MKQLLTIVFIGLVLGGCENDKNGDEKVELERVYFKSLEIKEIDPLSSNEYNMIAYYKGKPFNGIAWDLHNNQNKRTENIIKDGKPNGLSKSWYSNGNKKNFGNYKDGKRCGLAKLWYKNGQLGLISNWKDGTPDGLYIGWHENGQLDREGNFKDGKLDGLCKKWYENSQLTWEKIYIDGEIISQKCWDEEGNEIECN